jgi:DNA-binding PadR family transcriptional regulator
MYISSMATNELIKGTLGTIILTLLQENGRMYGYDITRVVKERTDSKILLKEGSLYPALHKLLADGLVKTEEEFVGNRPRVYYSLTAAGKKQIAARKEELFGFMETIQMLIEPKKRLANG